MGHGIAQVAAQAGYAVLLYDVTEELYRKGLQRIAENLQSGVAKGKVTAEQKAGALERLRGTSELKELAGCGLVVEAAPEDMALKQKLFRQLSEIVAPDAVLASNTSSLSLTEIAASARGPERVLGMHFFNPVHAMKLLELVRGQEKYVAEAAEASRQVYQAALGAAGRGPITTEIREAPEFYYAEAYHQQYLAKNPGGYCGLGGTGVSCPTASPPTA